MRNHENSRATLPIFCDTISPDNLASNSRCEETEEKRVQARDAYAERLKLSRSLSAVRFISTKLEIA